MHTLNIFIIPIILTSLFYNKIKFSYVIALLVSLAVAIFVYAQQNLANILFTIAIFNLTPLSVFYFKRLFQRQRDSWEEKKAAEKDTHQQLSKEYSLIKQSNLQLDKEVSQIVELYRMLRDMSAVLEFKEIFDILGRKLMENFRFERSRLILIDEDGGALQIKEVLEIRYGQLQTSIVDAEDNDTEVLKQSLRAQKISYIEEKSLILAPLTGDNKFLGALVVEEMPVNALDKFSILMDQFLLEFKRISLYQKIQNLAITDGLTKLFVRRYFLERLDEEIKRSNRHNLQLALLMIDIDHFKQCNDSFGHLTGDVILAEVAKKIVSNVREIDLVARFGGEEFSVLLPDTGKADAANVAERIRQSIARCQFKAYDETINIEVSIGVASFAKDATAIQQLIDLSDQALYRAKQEGRNRVCMAE